MENNLINAGYDNFIVEIKNKIRKSQYEAMKAVNTTLINLYWGIGEEIYNQQQEKCWGKSIVEVLSKEIQKEFPEVKGFSAINGLPQCLHSFTSVLPEVSFNNKSVIQNLLQLFSEINFSTSICMNKVPVFTYSLCLKFIIIIVSILIYVKYFKNFLFYLVVSIKVFSPLSYKISIANKTIKYV